MMEVIFLMVLLVVQQGFYMYHQHKLINKLMSRNYHEYIVSSPGPKHNKKIDPNDVQPWEVEDLRGLPDGVL